MTSKTPAQPIDADILATLRQQADVSIDEMRRAGAESDFAALVYEQLDAVVAGEERTTLRRTLGPAAHASAAVEAVRTREVVSVLDALNAHAIHPILIKGTPLAHTIYQSPAARAHEDTDLVFRYEQIHDIRRCMRRLGYVEPLLSDGPLLFRQFQMCRRDTWGIDHPFDFHWQISSQSAFADLLSYDELAAAAVPVPRLGPHARAAGPLHALLLACVHPVMHHRNAERFVWLLDIHLLASRLSSGELEQFTRMAVGKQVGAVCAHQLERCRSRLGTPVSDAVIARLAARAPREATAAYLRTARRWHNDLASNLRGMARLSDRVRLLRQVCFPGAQYMLAAYGLGNRGRPVLPLLYVHRNLAGLWKILRGRK